MRTTISRGFEVRQKRGKLLAVCAAGLALAAYSVAPQASAIGVYTLPVGGNILASPSAFPTGGTVLDTVTTPFTSSTIDGTVVSQVISGDPSNPYGGLTFTYSLSMNTFSSDSASEITIGSYGNTIDDVSFNLTGAEVAPSNFTRSTTGDGSVIRFLFANGGGLMPGQTGALVVVQSSATAFAPAVGGVIDSQTVNISTLAPVPEPGIVSLFVAALGVFGLWRRNSK